MFNLFGKQKTTATPVKPAATRRSSGAKSSIVSRRNQIPLEGGGPFVGKDPLRLDVLILNGSHEYRKVNGEAEKGVLTDILGDLVEDSKNKASTIQTNTYHREVFTNTLELPGYQLMVLSPPIFFSRMRNFEANRWREKAHEKADCFVFTIDAGDAEAYLDGDSRGPGSGRPLWERDIYKISEILTKKTVIDNPQKPFLLLVKTKEEFDVERLVNLLGIGGNELYRPFRAVSYTSGGNNQGILKEAIEWLKQASCTTTSDDDETMATTESDTEEEGSVMSTSFTVSSNLGSTPSDTIGAHYVLDYEPTLLGGNPTLQRFEPIKKGTHCPFARAAKLWGGKMPSPHKPRLSGTNRVDTIQEIASLNANPLAEFVARSNNGERLDGFCLEVPGAEYVSAEQFGDKVRQLLTALAALDPSPGENAMKSGPIDHPHWRFRFAGEDFFLTTFSPMYKQHSSRYAFGAGKAFILFQPMTSFGRHGLKEDTPASATKWKNPVTMRDKARVAFKENGCPYHIPEKLPYPVAEHIVKPLENDDGNNVVRWWEPLSPPKRKSTTARYSKK